MKVQNLLRTTVTLAVSVLLGGSTLLAAPAQAAPTPKHIASAPPGAWVSHSSTGIRTGSTIQRLSKPAQFKSKSCSLKSFKCVRVSESLKKPSQKVRNTLKAFAARNHPRANSSATPSRMAAADDTGSSYIPVPQYCIDNGIVTSYSVTRFDACGAFDVTGEVFRTVDGVEEQTGSFDAVLVHYMYMAKDQTTWASQITLSPSSESGDAVGASFEMTPACVGSACTLVSSYAPSQAPAVGEQAQAESYFSWPDDVVNSYGTGAPVWYLTVVAGQAVSNPVSQTGPETRCDNMIPSLASGCVESTDTPEINYDQGYWPNFGNHVDAAQQSGLPGGEYWDNTTLHRTQDQDLMDANRGVACPASIPRPSGDDCDEYPFASTREGASASGGHGGRTFYGCQVSSLPTGVTGATGYSICMIDSSENRRAGSFLNSDLYMPYRIIDGDPFYVNIFYNE